MDKFWKHWISHLEVNRYMFYHIGIPFPYSYKESWMSLRACRLPGRKYNLVVV